MLFTSSSSGGELHPDWPGHIGEPENRIQEPLRGFGRDREGWIVNPLFLALERARALV